MHSRVRIDLVQKATSIVSIKDTGVSPKPIWKWLQINYLDHEHISRFGPGYVERSRQVMDLSEIDLFDIIRVVVVLDLASGPIYALNVDDFAILDCAGRRYYGKGISNGAPTSTEGGLLSGCHRFYDDVSNGFKRELNQAIDLWALIRESRIAVRQAC